MAVIVRIGFMTLWRKLRVYHLHGGDGRRGDKVCDFKALCGFVLMAGVLCSYICCGERACDRTCANILYPLHVTPVIHYQSS